MSAQEVAAGNPLSLGLTSPASSPLRERSHSALLDAPADHSPTRRLSDSAAIVGAATSPTTPSAATLPRNHSKAGSEELRRWAAEAMAQRPNLAHPNPHIDTSSTSEAPSSSDPLLIKPSASRPESPALGGRWHGSSEIGGATRPLSMHVDSVTTSHDDTRPTSYQFPDPRPPASTTSSTAMMSDASHVDESLGFTRTSSLGRRSQWALPRDESAAVLQVDETGRRASSPHIDPPKTSGGRRTAYVDVPFSNGRDGTRRSPLAPILTAGRPREPATQRAQSGSHEVPANRLASASHAQPFSRLRPDSPIAEAPQSDDEDPPLGTPVDGYLANAMSASSVRRGSVQPGDTPPSDTLSDLPAARSGINFGVGAIGASAEASGPLSQLSLRRGSASDAAGKPSLRLVPSLKREAVATPHAVNEAPQLSHSTLVSLGEVEGISPPIPLSALSATGPSLPIGSTSIDATSVVTQGLEMGLGVHMAAAALNTCLPGASTGFASLAEPRFARMSVASSGIGMPSAATVAASALPSEMSSMGLSFKVTDAQISAADTLTGLRDSRRGPKSDHASIANGSSEDKPLSKIAEADLGRRRTTGNLGARTRGGPANHPNVTFSVDPLPHRRAGTLDHTSASASSRQMPDMYAYAGGSPALGGTTLHGTNSKGSATHPSIPENDAVYLPFGAVYSSQSSSHSTSGHAGLTSAQDSTQADTPSLGQKAILSPDANSRGSYLGDTSVAGQARESGQDPTGPRLNAPIGAAALANSIGGGGHFGPQVREKLMEVLQTIVGQVPLSGEDGETIHIAEYGSLNSRSAPLLRDVISMFAQRAYESLAYRASAQAASHPSTLSSQSSRLADDGSYFGGVDVAHLGAPTVVAESIDLQPSTLAFSITHEDASSDFRTLAQVLESGESYLDNAWQASHRPPLQNSIFNAYVARSFASRVAPPKTMHMGFSLMDLHWLHTPRNSAVSLATTAHAELTAFLTARAHEFRSGGRFIIAFIARSEPDTASPSFSVRHRASANLHVSPDESHNRASAGGSPVSTSSATQLPAGTSQAMDTPHVSIEKLQEHYTLQQQRSRSSSSPAQHLEQTSRGRSRRGDDIWTALTNTLAPCIQRLVSCGMLKSDVARHMLLLPMHPRTPRQTRAVLKSVRHLWTVDWSCGLGHDESLRTTSQPSSAVGSPTQGRPPPPPSPLSGRRGSTTSTALPSEAMPLRLAHPAWKAYRAGALPRVVFIEHLLALFKSLYEVHMRLVLKERGKLSKGACEFVLDSLWDVLQSRLDDQGTSPIEEIEVEVTVCALRRL